MQYHFSPVWFATKTRLESITKMIAFDDFGSLDVTTDRLDFSGRKHSFRMSHVQNVSLAGQRLAWVHYLWILPLVSLFPWIVFKGITSIAPEYLLLHTLLLMWGIISVLLIALSIVFQSLVSRSTKWIEITYLDEEQRPHQVYLADGSALGWGGILGGTMKIYQVLRNVQR